MATDMEAATEINPRWAGTVNKALQAVGAAAWPQSVAAGAATLKADLEAAAAALAADDLAGATAAVQAVHSSQHGLSNAVYDWLSQQAGKLAGPAATPTPAATPAAQPSTGGSPDGGDGTSAGIYVLVVLGGLVALVGLGAISWRFRSRKA